MKTFKFNVNNKEYLFICETNNSRYGFTHVAHLLVNNWNIGSAKMHYLNRTWECYQYQSVISQTIYNVIKERIEELKSDYKTENNIKKLSPKHKELFNSYLANDSLYNEYKEVEKLIKEKSN